MPRAAIAVRRSRCDQRFCGSCGQRTGLARLTMGQILHDFMHALTHADHSIFSLVKDLFVRPGHVAREYVEGKRKKYFGPFAFLVITVGLASLVVALTGVEWFRPIPDARRRRIPAAPHQSGHADPGADTGRAELAVVPQRAVQLRRAPGVHGVYLGLSVCLVFALVTTPAVYFSQPGRRRGRGAVAVFFAVGGVLRLCRRPVLSRRCVLEDCRGRVWRPCWRRSRSFTWLYVLHTGVHALGYS